MKRKIISTILGVIASLGVASAAITVSEIHYDTVSGDSGEFIEIAVTAPDLGVDLSTVTLSLYNGGTGGVYNSFTLDTFTAGSNDGTTAYYSLPITGIQNGSPDGWSIDTAGTINEFVSYEGTFDATDGPATGLTSTDSGIVQTSIDAGTSSQKQADGTWLVGPQTPGAANIIPEASSLLLVGVLGLFYARRKRNK